MSIICEKCGNKQFEIWSEGFSATGDEDDKARKHGVVDAENFQSACDKFAESNYHFRNYYDSKRLTFWGCRLFDDEKEARKSFG